MKLCELNQYATWVAYAAAVLWLCAGLVQFPRLPAGWNIGHEPFGTVTLPPGMQDVSSRPKIQSWLNTAAAFLTGISVYLQTINPCPCAGVTP